MWGVVIFVLYVIRVVGGVSLWVVCMFRRVDVCWSIVQLVDILSVVFCVICNLLMFVPDASGDHQVSAKPNTQIPGPAIYTENRDSQLTQT